MTEQEIAKAIYEARVKMTVQADRCGAVIVGNAHALHYCWSEMSEFARRDSIEKMREAIEILNTQFTALCLAMSAEPQKVAA